MRRFASSRLFAVALGILLSLGLGLVPVHSGLMAAEMTAAVDADMQGHEGCGDCGSETAAAPDCMASCIAYAVALPSLGPKMAITGAAGKVLADSRISPGRLPAPDPHPPRTDEIG